MGGLGCMGAWLGQGWGQCTHTPLPPRPLYCPPHLAVPSATGGGAGGPGSGLSAETLRVLDEEFGHMSLADESQRV